LFNNLFSFLRRNSDFFEQPESGFAFIEKSFKQEKLKFEEKKKKEKEKTEKLQKAEKNEKVEKEKDGVRQITKEEFEKLKKEEKNTSLNSEQAKEVKNEVKEEEEDSETKRIKDLITKMDEEERKQLLKKTAHLDDKNGGRSRNYSWIQPQIEQFEMFIPIDKEVKCSEIKIEFDSKNLKVKVRNDFIINGQLFAPIISDSFLWQIDENKGEKYISITFDKLKKMEWWDYVIKGDDILSLSKHNPEPSKLSDLDPSMRPEVEKMMIENSMKMQGKPFHKDPKTNDVLQKFMQQHPEMDFSKAKIN
jgi:hypothetical protein